MKKQYLPDSVYNVLMGAAATHALINFLLAVLTTPENRFLHIMMVFLHTSMIFFWIWQKKKSQNYVPKIKSIKSKEFSISQATFLKVAVTFFAVLAELFAFWMNWEFLQMNARYGLPITVGSLLTQFSLHVSSLSLGYALIAVANRALRDARAAALKPQEAAPTTTVAPEARPTWWTQDETRQEIKRR
jgi:hypothetical protein